MQTDQMAFEGVSKKVDGTQVDGNFVNMYFPQTSVKTSINPCVSQFFRMEFIQCF